MYHQFIFLAILKIEVEVYVNIKRRPQGRLFIFTHCPQSAPAGPGITGPVVYTKTYFMFTQVL